MEEKVSRLEKEKEEYLEGWKRAKADFLNMKKEEEERVREFIKFGNEAIIRSMVSVLESFYLGLMAWKEETPEKKGMMLVRAQLEETLKKYGVEIIQAKIGEEFNPEKHECLLLEASESPTGTITEEVEKGYALYGKIIRPVRVKVSK